MFISVNGVTSGEKKGDSEKSTLEQREGREQPKVLFFRCAEFELPIPSCVSVLEI